ncbi:MAG: sigma-54-dependent Fis family transcriptional regulator [Deltaproteobacteria bacterium]|nr:sigma-54-dependent Fis family transcriptional regulator [Deltaproteobacteria bacterium]
MNALDLELRKTKEEIDRLVRNWRALLDVMPEMVVLIREDCVIEYMNPSAVTVFGDLCRLDCRQHLCNAGDRCGTCCPIKLSASGKRKNAIEETRISNVDVEYSFAPFHGYLGDRLVMLVMRDVTERKLHELELASFHNNIEEILQQKIGELKESEKTQQNLFREINVLKRKLQHKDQADEMIGTSRKMRELREMIDQVAGSDATILITGESGTGKELVANLIRKFSPRVDKPFLKVNCNSINDNLLESDLFGYEKGAFTGAGGRKKGKFEIVDGGTIFLDEIGDISPKMQSSLLRVLQNGEVIRVGGNTPVNVDVRVIAATNVDLVKAVHESVFRLDLYYRLNIINIVMPALRERKEDIVDLATYFVKRYREAFKKDVDFLPDSIISRLLMHDWPGNVRELENVIQRAVLMCKNSVITEQDLIFSTKPSSSPTSDYLDEVCRQFGKKSLKDIIADFEKELIVSCLQKNEGNVQVAANELQVGKTGLYDKMKRFGIAAKAVKP